MKTNTNSSEKMSSFEITAHQRLLARDNKEGLKVLDAGRGNPNWINTKARYAFNRLMSFALSECENEYCDQDLAGHGYLEGIGERFDALMNPCDRIDAFLNEAINYCVEELSLNKDALLKEFVDGLIGDYYPYPTRCLSQSEVIVNAYLQKVLYKGRNLKDKTEIFLTEGGSAAICYVIDALCHNRLLKKGDKIAIATPIFAPYLEIPVLNDYDLVTLNLSAKEENSWDIHVSELEKLHDKSIKAFFIVNPSNPAAHAYSDEVIDAVVAAVKANPDLIVVTDDVYSTFADDFRTIYSVIPYNTILIYSFSKLYGVTGWRLGVIAMAKDNICNNLLGRLGSGDKAFLEKEYSKVTTDVNNMSFIDRINADSRLIGLYHAGGLNTPSQIFIDLLALTHLVCDGEDVYISQSKKIVRDRYNALMSSLGLEADVSSGNIAYYTLVNTDELCNKHYGKEFAKWKKEHISDLKLLNDLAVEKGVVLTYGPGFDAPAGYVRVSLANLTKADYIEIAHRTLELMDAYHQQFLSQDQ